MRVIFAVTKVSVLRDLLLVVWWAFILWLLVTGMKQSTWDVIKEVFIWMS